MHDNKWKCIRLDYDKKSIYGSVSGSNLDDEKVDLLCPGKILFKLTLDSID